ncbi:MAG: NAD-dependent epimerase/dehydratase family protein [Microgenomates group bacterium]
MSKEKYLITGAAGFIGANLTRALIEQGKEVYPLVGLETNTWRLKDLDNERVNYVTVDVTDYAALKAELSRLRPTHVFHLATYGVHRDQADQLRIFNTNVLGTANLLRASLDLDLAAFVNTGSVFEYGNLPGQQCETSLGQPRSMYDLAKIIGTQTATNFARHYGLPVCTLRLFNAYGPYEDKRRLVASVIQSLLRGKVPDIRTPQSIRDFIYTQDIVDAHCRASSRSDWQGEVINIGSGQPTTVEMVVKKVAAILGLDEPHLDSSQAIPSQDSQSWADIKTARKLLHWQPENDLDTGLERTIKWFQEHQDLYEK